MNPEDAYRGAFVRLLYDYLKVPAGTLATVETTRITTIGDFYFTVRWLTLKPGTQARPISDRSLNLFFSDLEKFECVPKEEAEQILAASRLPRQKKLPAWLRMRGNPNQLRLFVDD